MKKYNSVDTQEKIISKVICNKCGKTIANNLEVQKKDYLSIEKSWNYFSEKDAQIHYFDICEECYDHLIKDFVIEPTVKSQTIVI